MSSNLLFHTIRTGLLVRGPTSQMGQQISRHTRCGQSIVNSTTIGHSATTIGQSRTQSTLNQSDDFSVVSSPAPSSEITTGQSAYHDDDLPLLINRTLKYPEMFNPKLTLPREAWVEDFSGVNQRKLAIIKLHPKIFAQFPRPDTVKRNLDWQNDLHWVNFLSVKVRNELPFSTKKPWPQKGQGKARHGSKVAPQWRGGGWVKGPRGEEEHFSS